MQIEDSPDLNFSQILHKWIPLSAEEEETAEAFGGIVANTILPSSQRLFNFTSQLDGAQDMIGCSVNKNKGCWLAAHPILLFVFK